MLVKWDHSNSTIFSYLPLFPEWEENLEDCNLVCLPVGVFICAHKLKTILWILIFLYNYTFYTRCQLSLQISLSFFTNISYLLHTEGDYIRTLDCNM